LMAYVEVMTENCNVFRVLKNVIYNSFNTLLKH